MKIITTTLFFGILLLFGAVPEAAAQDTVNYECGSGSPLTVTFQGSDSVRIDFDGTRANLRRVDSGSGARYTGNSDSGKVTFWTQGDEAQITVGGGFDGRCREVRSNSGGGSSSGGDTFSYVCGDIPLTATFADDGSSVRFSYDGNSYNLRRSGSGSGARYAGNNQGRRVTFWTKGQDEATLTVGDFTTQCTGQ